MTANGKVKVSGYISPVLHDRLRKLSFKHRIPLSTMVTEGLRAVSEMAAEELAKFPQDQRLSDNHQ